MRLHPSKLLPRLKLGQVGATHLIIPILAVLLVGGIGTYLVTQTHAATTHTGVEMGNSDLCMRYSSTSNTLTLQPCSASDSGQYWSIGSRILESTSNGEDRCLVPNLPASGSGAANVSVTECYGTIAANEWSQSPPWSGAGTNVAYSVGEYNGGKGPKRCLVDSLGESGESGGPFQTTGCDTSKENYVDQNFHNITLPNSTPTPTPKPTPTPTPPKPTPVATGNCTKSDFSSGSSGTCVTAIQGILNAAYIYFRVEHPNSAYKGSSITVDGEFGSLTEAQVKIFQSYFEGASGVDGIVGPNTWSSMCSVAASHDTADYKRAGC